MPDNHQRRWQPLLQQWVIVAAKSQSRPWSGQTVGKHDDPVPQHDTNCYLCPGVTRANGKVNPDYEGPWAFDNDFAALRDPAADPVAGLGPDVGNPDDSLHRTAPATGRCRVLCWNERHDKTMSDLDEEQMRQVAQLWLTEFRALIGDKHISQVLIFENKGMEVGVSNRHPHGQIYATGFVTDSATRMRDAQAGYAATHAGRSLLQDMIQRPEYETELLIEKTRHFKTIVPFAARYPYETWIVPRQHRKDLNVMTPDEIDDLASCYQRQAQRYDRLFRRPSPNVTLLHNAPCDDSPANEHWCFHIAMQPPLRDSSTLKYLAGFESGANNIVNPVQPEEAAARLRESDANASGARET